MVAFALIELEPGVELGKRVIGIIDCRQSATSHSLSLPFKTFKGIGGTRENHTPCASRRSLKILRGIFFEKRFGLGRHLNERSARSIAKDIIWLSLASGVKGVLVLGVPDGFTAFATLPQGR